MAKKKKNFFSSFDNNLSIKEEVATINKQAPAIVKTSSIASTSTPVAKEVAATPVQEKAIPEATPKADSTPTTTKLIKKVPAPKSPTPKPPKKKTAPLAKPTTFRIDVELIEDIKAVAFWERKKIQDVLDDALRSYIGKIPKPELSKAKKAFSAAN